MQMQVAPYWHPVSKVQAIPNWEEVAVLLKVGSRFDLQPVLQKAVSYITANSNSLSWLPDRPRYIWKWIQLADMYCLEGTFPALAERLVVVHKSSCTDSNKLQGLSSLFLQQLVMALASAWK